MNWKFFILKYYNKKFNNISIGEIKDLFSLKKNRKIKLIKDKFLYIYLER